jgi:hypothetical protein
LVAPGKRTVQKLPDFKMTSSKYSTLAARIERWPIACRFCIGRRARIEAGRGDRAGGFRYDRGLIYPPEPLP